MARTFGVDWIAIHVQTASADTASESNRSRVDEHLRLAERLGAKVEIVTGNDVSATVIEYARQNQVTRIVIGKGAGTGLRRYLRKGIAARIVRRSGGVDVIVVRGESTPRRVQPPLRRRRNLLEPPLLSVSAVAVATAIGSLFDRGSVATANIVMIYLLTAFSASVLSGWLTGLTTSILAVLAFNFFFTRPYYTLNVSDPQYLVTIAVMIVVTLVSSSLAARVKLQAALSSERERRARTLYELSRKLSEAGGEERVCAVAQEELTGLLGNELTVVASNGVAELSPGTVRESARRCVRDSRSIDGAGTDGGETATRVLPLEGKEAVVGVIVLPNGGATRQIIADDPSLFAGMTSLIAFALEREQASVRARERLVEIENEKMRNAVLRGISHDLRTPLAAISGSVTTLLRGNLDAESTRNLTRAIAQEADWMGRVVENMLHATRLEAGGLQLEVNLEPVDDLVTAAVSRVSRQAAVDGTEPSITVTLPEELLVAPMDLALMEQVLINVLDNAVRYSPPGSPVTVAVYRSGESIDIVVEDEGPGIRTADRDHIFEKFFRGGASRSIRGTGLGLWISEAIVTAHHGTIDAENRESGGSRFRVSLPTRPQS